MVPPRPQHSAFSIQRSAVSGQLHQHLGIPRTVQSGCLSLHTVGREHVNPGGVHAERLPGPRHGAATLGDASSHHRCAAHLGVGGAIRQKAIPALKWDAEGRCQGGTAGHGQTVDRVVTTERKADDGQWVSRCDVFLMGFEIGFIEDMQLGSSRQAVRVYLQRSHIDGACTVTELAPLRKACGIQRQRDRDAFCQVS